DLVHSQRTRGGLKIGLSSRANLREQRFTDWNARPACVCGSASGGRDLPDLSWPSSLYLLNLPEIIGAFAQRSLLPPGWLREVYIKWYNTPPLSPWNRPGKRGNMKRELLRLAVLVCFCVPLLAQQVQITKLEINTVPADRRVRPFENVAVQV